MTRLLHTLALAALIVLSVLSLDARHAGVRADDSVDCITGSADTAIRACSEVIKSGRWFGKPITENELPSIYATRGNAYGRKGQYDRVIEDYDKAIKLFPIFGGTYNSRAWFYFKWGKAAKGLPDANKAIELAPKFAAAYDTRGRIYEALERKNEAIADFRKAFELDPSDEDYKEHLKRLGASP